MLFSILALVYIITNRGYCSPSLKWSVTLPISRYQGRVTLKKLFQTGWLVLALSGLLLQAALLLAQFLFAGPANARDLNYQHGFSLFNEQRYPADFSHFNYLNPDAPKGGRLVLSTGEDINNFSDEWDNTIEVAPGMSMTYDHLLIRADDELSGYYGKLAEGVAVTDDLHTIAFRLRPEARWHDGKPLTAHDVHYTYSYAKTTVDGTLFIDWIDSIEVLGDYEIVFHLAEKLTTSNLALFGYVQILPAHYWQGKNPSKATMVPPLGSGPYRVADFAQGRFVRYERVCDYWGRDLPVNRGRSNFDEIRFDVYRDGTVAREALRKSLFDAYVESDLRHWTSSYNIPARDEGLLLMTEAANEIFIGPQAVIAFNSRKAPFNNLLVREALVTAMDYDWLNRVLNHGLFEQPNSYFANSVFASSGLPEAAELEVLEPYRDQIPSRVFTDTYNNPQSSGFGRNREALLRARALLAKAGWKLDDGKLVNKDNEQFRIEFLSSSATQKRILLPYIDALNILGIDAWIRLVETAQLINRRREYDFDAMIQGYQMMVPPDLMGNYFLHSSAANSPVTGNVAGVADPVVDFLLEKLGAATTLEQMIASSRALDRVLLWSFYHVPLHAFSNQRIVHWNKFGRADLDYKHMNQSVFPVGWWYDEQKMTRIPGDVSADTHSCPDSLTSSVVQESPTGL